MAAVQDHTIREATGQSEHLWPDCRQIDRDIVRAGFAVVEEDIVKLHVLALVCDRLLAFE